MGLFGALFLLATGGAYAIKGIKNQSNDDYFREAARKEGRKYYYSHDGERRVDNNHKILRVSGKGIQDMVTGEWLYDQQAETNKLKEINRKESYIFKEKAISKGEKKYKCRVDESDKNLYLYGTNRWGYYYRLCSNDMPVKEFESGFTIRYKWYKDKMPEELRKELVEKYSWSDGTVRDIHYDNIVEHNFEFKMFGDFHYYGGKTFKDDKIEDENLKRLLIDYISNQYENYKEQNMRIMSSICNVYPINEVEHIYKYAKKYNIPLGTWEEIEEMMLEEHPLGWRKKSPSLPIHFGMFLSKHPW